MAENCLCYCSWLPDFASLSGSIQGVFVHHNMVHRIYSGLHLRQGGDDQALRPAGTTAEARSEFPRNEVTIATVPMMSQRGPIRGLPYLHGIIEL